MTRTLDSALAATHKSPSKKQVAAGNYRKGKCSIHGLTISIENPAGTVRKKGWKPLSAHYGYILRTEGRDGEHVDCFIGPNPNSEVVFVVDQVHESGRFDEHKVMIGWSSKRAAKKAYLANYPTGWKCGPITAMTVDQFKAWLQDGDTTSRVEKQVSSYAKLKSMAGQRAIVWNEDEHPRDELGEFAPKGTQEQAAPESGTGSKKTGRGGVSKAEAIAQAMGESRSPLARYEQMVNATYIYTGTKPSDWAAVPIKEVREVDDGNGGRVSMPIFDFPSGYEQVETPHSGESCCSLCGHGIKKAYHIQDDEHKLTMIVGSECVTNFGEGESGHRLNQKARWAANRDVLRQAWEAYDAIVGKFGHVGKYSIGDFLERQAGIRNSDDRKAAGAEKMIAIRNRANEIVQTREGLYDLLYTSKKAPILHERQKFGHSRYDAASDQVVSGWIKRNGDRVRELLEKADQITGDGSKAMHAAKKYQRMRYDRSAGMPMPAAPQKKLQVGQTKSVGGVTYRLNENHRWELADHDDPETAHSAAKASDSEPGAPQAKPDEPSQPGAAKPNKPAKPQQGRPSDDTGGQEARQKFVEQARSKVDPGVRGLIAAIHESPTYKAGGEFVSFDVNPKAAAALYAGLQQHAGKEMGGGKVVDLGEGRMGFASDAGSLVIWPPDEQGRQRVSYTNRTGVVSRAMQGGGQGAGEAQPGQPAQPEPAAQPVADKIEKRQSPKTAEEATKYRDEAAGQLHDALDAYEADLESGQLSAEENRWHKAKISMLRQKLTHAKGEVQRFGGGKTTGKPTGKQKYRVGDQEYELTPEEADKLSSLGLMPASGDSAPPPSKGKKAAYLEKGPDRQRADKKQPKTPEKTAEPATSPDSGATNVAPQDSQPSAGPEASTDDSSHMERARQLLKEIPAISPKGMAKQLGVDDATGKRVHEAVFAEKSSKAQETAKPTAEQAAKAADKEQHAATSPAWKNHAKQAAEAYGMDPETYTSFATELFKEYGDRHAAEVRAISQAKKMAGLNAGDVQRLENQGHDYASDHPRLKNFDVVAQTIAREVPELGWNADDQNADHEAKLWELLKKPARKAPTMLSPDFLDHLDSYIQSLAGSGSQDDNDAAEQLAKLKEWESVPFSRRNSEDRRVLRYSFDSRDLRLLPAKN